MSNFKVGEKVVCVMPIDDLVLNDIYTISGLVKGSNGNGVRLLEVYTDWLGFNVNRFRKLDTQFAEDICAKIIEEFKQETILN